ncbi:cytochrome c oxidase subunit II [Gammaproteobacteria bacterium 53_120_T64]|nr:cytochrome c oxidase subunit II [Gammaproteobacteria bacterium 53_120_T64]
MSFVGQLARAEDAHASGWSLLNMTEGVTGVSHDIYDLHMTVVWICVWISVVVYGVMFYSMFAHRKSRGAKASNFHESTVVELLWTIVPVLILIWVAFPSTRVLIDLYDTSEADIDIKVTGYQWKWQYEYLGEGVEFMSELTTSEAAIYNLEPKTEYYLSEVNEPLVLPIGKKVRFLLTAKDVIHAWWVPELGVKRDAVPGFINETWAKIDEPGIYRGFCAELCGKGHAFMPIVVNAVSEEEYAVWLAAKKEAAAAQREMAKQSFTFEQLMAKGEESYNRSCAGCHAANGEGIPGAFPALKGSAVALGPVAKHLDVVVNGTAGTAMQAFGGQLSEVDLAAIITYERNAWGNDVGDMVQPIDVLKFKQGQ